MPRARFVIYIYDDVSRFFSLPIDLEASYRELSLGRS